MLYAIKKKSMAKTSTIKMQTLKNDEHDEDQFEKSGIDQENDTSATGVEVNMGSKRTQHGFLSGNRQIWQILTSAVHVVTVFFIIVIFYLCFSNEITLFSWHPALLTVGWSLIVLEAILTFHGHNLLTRKLSFADRAQVHGALQFMAIGVILVGFIIIVINKNIHNYSHFVSYHSQFGLASIILLLMSSLGGICASNSTKLKQFVNPAILKFLHGLAGAGTFSIGSITLILGLYTGWFESNGSLLLQIFFTLTIIASMLITLIKPLSTSYARVRGFLKV